MSKQTQQAPVERLTSLYVGRLREDQDPNDLGPNAGRCKGQYALGGPHTLLVGGTGTGKGRKVLMQNIVMWGRRPVVAMSCSGDLVEGTIRRRAARGPVYLLDLNDEVLDSELQGIDVQRVVCDPCALITTDDEAKKMADLLLATTESSGEDSMWAKNATRQLAGFLRAGGELTNTETGEVFPGGGIAWVLDALDRPELEEGEEVDVMEPSWDAVITRNRDVLETRYGQIIRTTKMMDPRQRDSVVMNIRAALDPWTLSTVTGDGTGVPFHPSMLDQPGATLYIVAPMDGSAAGAAAAVIEQAIAHWRKNVARKMPVLGLFLDEVAACARLKSLPAHVATLRKYNIRLLAALQSVVQMKDVWGDNGMEVLMRIFPSMLILPSTPDREPYELASWFAGEMERSTSSVDEYGRANRSSDRMEQVTARELTPREQGTARLLIAGGPGVLVDIPDISKTNLR